MNNLFTESGPPHVLFPGTMLAGAVRLRQMRIAPKCDTMQQHVPKMFQYEMGSQTGCWPSWSEGVEDKATYGIGVLNTFNTTTDAAISNDDLELKNKLKSCFTYTDGITSAPITHQTTVSLTGWEESYPSSGGYVCDLSGNYTHLQALSVLQDLQKYNWVRGLIHEGKR